MDLDTAVGKNSSVTHYGGYQKAAARLAGSLFGCAKTINVSKDALAQKLNAKIVAQSKVAKKTVKSVKPTLIMKTESVVKFITALEAGEG